jgi:hypothetical protein
MKRERFFLVLIGVFCLIQLNSCHKDTKSLKSPAQIIDADKITGLILDFRTRLMSKSSETMTIDSVEWYLEGLLNFEKANNFHENTSVFVKDSISINCNNGSVLMDEILSAYAYFQEKLQAFKTSQSDTSFKINAVDLSISQSSVKNSNYIEIIMTAGGGLGGQIRYQQFIPPESWYFYTWPGRCDPNAPIIYHGASYELTWRFNSPVYTLISGYFINLEQKRAIPTANPSLPGHPNPGPYGQYMIFYAEVPQSFDPCIGTDELNYYLSTYDYLVAKYQPGTKLICSMHVLGFMGIGSPNYTKWYEYSLQYGDFIPYENDH